MRVIIMANEKWVYKKLNLKMFSADDVITDLAGNVFLKREAVAKLFQCSLPTLATTYKRKGLLTLDRYISGHKVYLIDDVERFYNQRAAY